MVRKKFMFVWALIITLAVSFIPSFRAAKADDVPDGSSINSLYSEDSESGKIQNDKITTEKEKLVQQFLKDEKVKKTKGVQKIDSLGVTSIFYYTYVPVYSQITAFYCGAATALQTIGNWQWSY